MQHVCAHTLQDLRKLGLGNHSKYAACMTDPDSNIPESFSKRRKTHEIQHVSGYTLVLGRFRVNSRKKSLCWEGGTAEGQVLQETLKPWALNSHRVQVWHPWQLCSGAPKSLWVYACARTRWGIIDLGHLLQDLSDTSSLLSKHQVPSWKKAKDHLEAVLLGAVPGGDTPQPLSDPSTQKLHNQVTAAKLWQDICPSINRA